jgi:hypothetical protein
LRSARLTADVLALRRRPAARDQRLKKSRSTSILENMSNA